MCPLWRIGLSEAALMRNYFRFFQIPEPNGSQYRDHSVTFSKSNGGLVQHGFATVTLRWDVLRADQAFFIARFVDGALGAVGSGTGQLYLTVPYNNAAKIAPRSWIDVVGVPHPMNITEGGQVGNSVGVYYENVTLFLNAVDIINDPALT